MEGCGTVTPGSELYCKPLLCSISVTSLQVYSLRSRRRWTRDRKDNDNERKK